ncbi:hypothetical protein BDC45DRAFT_447983, partial [Circinella umbellata]
SKLKVGVQQKLLTKDDPLTLRIVESARLDTPKDFEGWVSHLKSFFPRCLLEEEVL